MKAKSAAERFSNNVVTRILPGSFDSDEAHYLVNPSFFKKRKDGQLEVSGLGVAHVSEEDLSALKTSGMWVDFIDVSGMDP